MSARDLAVFLGMSLGVAALAGCETASDPAAGGSGGPAGSAAAAAVAAAPAILATEGSTIARAPDDDVIFVADEDHEAIRIVPIPLGDDPKVHSTSLPGRPAQIVAIGKRLLVTVRTIAGAKGALLVFDRDGAAGLKEAARIELPADAWGIGVDKKGTRAIVTSAWTAKVSLVDLASSAVLKTVDVGREPRGALIHPDGDRAYVTHLVGGVVTRIDGIATGELAAKTVELPTSPARSPVGKPPPASLGYAVTASPDGARLFFPRHAIGGLGGDAWFGTAAVDVLGADGDVPLAPGRTHGMPGARTPGFTELVGFRSWTPGSTRYSEHGALVFIQPRAVVYRHKTRTLLVASEGTDAIAELDAEMLDPTFGVTRVYRAGLDRDAYFDIAATGGAPSGIALSADEDQAYVHCRSTDELVQIQLEPGEGTFDTVPPIAVRLAEAPVDENYDKGRRLFYNATEQPMSGGIACAGCHPEGRDDGYVWHETTFAIVDPQKGADMQFPEDGKNTIFVASPEAATELLARWPGLSLDSKEPPHKGTGHPRQTPMLAGRVAAQGPYGWHAESKDLAARITAGFGLHRWQPSWGETESVTVARALNLGKFLREGLVPPPKVEGELSEEAKRGKAIFEDPASQCITCHVPQTGYTDRNAVPFREAPTPAGFVREDNRSFKTPSLLYVGGTPPYFHDGRYATLQELVDENADLMGRTSHLSADDKKALVAFLETL